VSEDGTRLELETLGGEARRRPPVARIETIAQVASLKKAEEMAGGSPKARSLCM